MAMKLIPKAWPVKFFYVTNPWDLEKIVPVTIETFGYRWFLQQRPSSRYPSTLATPRSSVPCACRDRLLWLGATKNGAFKLFPLVSLSGARRKIFQIGIWDGEVM